MKAIKKILKKITFGGCEAGMGSILAVLMLSGVVLIVAAAASIRNTNLQALVSLDKKTSDVQALLSQATQRTAILINSGRLEVPAGSGAPELRSSIGEAVTRVGNTAVLSGSTLAIGTYDPECMRTSADANFPGNSCRRNVSVEIQDRAAGSQYVRLVASYGGYSKRSAVLVNVPIQDKVCTTTTTTTAAEVTYNVVLIFDHSGSQKTTDPTKVRQTGGHHFVDKFLRVIKENPTVELNTFVIRFSSSARFMNNTPTAALPGDEDWFSMSGADAVNAPAIATKMKDAINWATNNPSGGTSYASALNVAGQGLARMQTKYAGSSRTIRNFVVFLTDGQPTDSLSGIWTAADNLMNTYRVPIFGLAAGRGLSRGGEGVVQKLTRPSEVPAAWNPDPGTRGFYYRATDPNDLLQVWDSTFSTIITSASKTECKDFARLNIGSCGASLGSTPNFPDCMEDALSTFVPSSASE